MPEPVLVVDDDPYELGMLTHVGRTRGLDVVGVRTPAEASKLLLSREFGVAVVDLCLGAESGLDVIRLVRARDPSTESIVMSDDSRLSSALESYAQDIFAFVPKPFDPVQLFATVDRALERRRGALERQRLTRELGLINEVAAIVTSSLDVSSVFQRALDRVAAAFQADFGYLRLRPISARTFSVVASVGLPRDIAETGLVEAAGWPSDRAISSGRPVRVDDAAAETAPGDPLRGSGWRSSLTVPIAASNEVLGALTLASTAAARFTAADEELLETIARQFAVAATNGQLYERVHRAKIEWERTFDAISDPIAVFDAGGRTMRVNAALARLRAWRITETQGRTCDEVGLCGGGCPNCVVGVAARESRRIDREITTAEDRIFTVTTLPLSGGPASVVQFAKEVTEERRHAQQMSELSRELQSANLELVSTLARLRATQAQLIQSEKLSAIGQLVAGVAHELNNPLTSILGYAQLVHEELAARPELEPGDEGLNEDVSRILSESERAAKIVRNLLTFARRQTSERERHDAANLCNSVVQLRLYDLRLKNIEVVTTFAEDLPPVYVDGSQIQQALLNLLLNAEQAMKDTPVRALRIHVTSEPECGAVLIEVSDNGHGIEPGNLRRVFDPFFTTRGVGEGTGLGLSIVYGIVRDHGGQIWVESELGKQTSFFVRLPARGAGNAAASLGVVLVAHDDAVFRDFLGAVFAGWGCSVRIAANTREALESLAEDQVGLAVLDRALIETDPASWRAAWAPLRGRASMIAITSASRDEQTGRFLREEATVVVAPPHDLCQIRRALVAATGVTP